MIFGNIRKFVIYLMSCNVSEVMVVSLAVSVGLPAPLLPLQILFLNLVTDVFPAFALGLGRGGASVMNRPPRDPAEPIIDGPHWRQIAVLGGVISAATLAAFAAALFGLGSSPAEAVSVAFLTLALAQIWNVFNMRSHDSGILANEVTRNPAVWGAIVLCLALLVLAFAVPMANSVLQLPWPGADGFWLALGASFLPLVAGQLMLAVGRSTP